MLYSGADMQGLHLTADLHQCRCALERFTDAAALAAACLEAVLACGLRPVAELFHSFPGAGAGVTATVLLAESHLCVHTWPEQRAATLDVYVCNYGADHSAKAQALLNALAALFEPGHVERHMLRRGTLVSSRSAQPDKVSHP
jgi:S-adenosylmethionine decarboxylase